jgi:large subunit ribosomal protein L25
MTTHAQLTASKRAIVGNKVKTFARQNITPAVVYSRSFPSTPIQVDTKEFLQVYKNAGRTHVIDLKIEGKTTPCLVQDLDVHPYKKTLRHVDFLVVNLKEKIVAEVPVTIVGIAPGVKELGAVLNIALDKLEVEALPDKMPEEIQVDVSVLADFDKSIYVSNLPESKEYKIVTDADDLVVNLVEQSQEEEAPTPETVVETAADKDSEKSE